MMTVKDFNPAGLPRRSYLSGKDSRFRSKFWMQTPMFVRAFGTDRQDQGSNHLHEWVLQADRESKSFKANPDRPRIWKKVGAETKPLKECTPNSLQRGDVVAVSFTVTYHTTATNWFPQFHPADIVVLRTSQGDATDYSGPSMGLHSRPAPSFGSVLDSEGELVVRLCWHWLDIRTLGDSSPGLGEEVGNKGPAETQAVADPSELEFVTDGSASSREVVAGGAGVAVAMDTDPEVAGAAVNRARAKVRTTGKAEGWFVL